MYIYNAKIINIVDGDTIDLFIDLGFDIHHEIRLRLNGIDAPEIRTKDLEEKKLGLEAKEYIQKLCEKYNYKCTVKTIKDKKGKYGRYLGDIYFGDESLSLLLISEGYAKKYPIINNSVT